MKRKDSIEEISLKTRYGTDSVKWDLQKEIFGDSNLIPVWVADMDFKIASCIREAICNYVQNGAFGYYSPPESYYESFINWEKQRHGYEVKRDWIRTSHSVVSAIYNLIYVLTEPNDSIIILTPVYYPFMNAIRNTKRNLIFSELINANGYYTIDFDDFEEKIKANKVRLFIHCSPHNPVSRVWKREELQRLCHICKKYDVAIISDEIHHDIVFGENKHLPTATISDHDMVFTVTSASKTFNLAGMKNAILIIENEKIRNEYDKFTHKYNLDDNGSTLDYIAVRAAYEGGGEWLGVVLNEIWHNYNHLKEILSVFPEIIVTPLEGTYLMWIDFSAVIPPEELKDFAQKECGIAPDYGYWFKPDRAQNDSFLRINLATPRENIEKVADNIVKALNKRKNI